MSIKNTLFFGFLILGYVTQNAQSPSADAMPYEKKCYVAIQALLNRYQRPFTILDIDTHFGFYSLHAAHDYNSVCVMMGHNEALLNTCKTHPELTNIILLNTTPTPETLQHLGQCEHFDVIFVLNSLHFSGSRSQEMIAAILSLGDYVIMEISSQIHQIEECVCSHGGQIIDKISIDQSAGTWLYIIECSNKYLRRKTWLRSVMTDNLYHIQSSFTHKHLEKPSSWPHGALKTTQWIPGINLCTFKMCHGIYPTSKQLKDCLHRIKDAEHTDWLMNNMIVQGTKLALIDDDDLSSKRYFSETLLRAHEELFDLDDPEKVEHYFWHKLIKVPVSIRQTVKFFSQLFPVCSLVFDIGSSNAVLIDRYLGYGTKLICCDLNHEVISFLGRKIFEENISLLSETFDQKKSVNNANLDDLITRYGKPVFCNIHLDPASTYRCIKTLSRPLKSIAFKFDIHSKSILMACLDHLAILGYTQFNFSVRDIPGFILENNPYINSRKEWACSIDELMREIEEFRKLDHDGENLWGYVYARYS